jgi:hypothetical protein
VIPGTDLSMQFIPRVRSQLGGICNATWRGYSRDCLGRGSDSVLSRA